MEKYRKFFHDRKIKTSEIYLQINPTVETKEGNVHNKICFRKDIIKSVIKNANLKNADCIGEIKGNKIFKLYC